MKKKTYTLEELRDMTDAELKEISLQRKSNGNFSDNANKAMQVRNERAGGVGFYGARNTSFMATLCDERGRYGTKMFK